MPIRPLIMKEGKMECPVCGKPMWDNRGKKRNPKAPDFRCKDEECKYSLNPDTGEYEPGDFPTGVWIKEVVKSNETQMKKTPQKESQEPKDEFIEGKKENNRLICRTDLMSAIIKGYNNGGTQDSKTIIDLFDLFWAKVKE